MMDSPKTGDCSNVGDVSTRDSRSSHCPLNHNRPPNSSSNTPHVENSFSKLLKTSGNGGKSSAKNSVCQSESESASKGDKESQADRVNRLEQMLKEMSENQGYYDAYYDEQEYENTEVYD